MRRRPLTVAAAAVLCAVALSSCGTGLRAQTYRGRALGDAVNAQVGDLALRNLQVEAVSQEQGAPQGGGALLTGVVVNTGDTDDSLVRASSDVAGEATLVSEAGGTELAVPAGKTSGTEWAVQLTDLTREVRPGQYVAVTLEFAKAGRTTVQVPVKTTERTLEDREQLQNPYGETPDEIRGETEGGTQE